VKLETLCTAECVWVKSLLIYSFEIIYLTPPNAQCAARSLCERNMSFHQRHWKRIPFGSPFSSFPLASATFSHWGETPYAPFSHSYFAPKLEQRNAFLPELSFDFIVNTLMPKRERGQAQPHNQCDLLLQMCNFKLRNALNSHCCIQELIGSEGVAMEIK